MAKLNFDDYDGLDQLKQYGVKIKTRYKKKRILKIKLPDAKTSRISKSKKTKQKNIKYD